MYVCMYICMYVCVYICVYIYIYIYILFFLPEVWGVTHECGPQPAADGSGEAPAKRKE